MIQSTDGHQDTAFTKLVDEGIGQITISTPQTEIEVNDGNGVTFTVDPMDATPFIEWVRETFSPDDIFDDDELDSWAQDNEYTKDTASE